MIGVPCCRPFAISDLLSARTSNSEGGGKPLGVQVHDAAGSAGPEEGMRQLAKSACRAVAISNLLIARSSVSCGACESGGIQVHDATRGTGPEKGVWVASACRAITISTL